MFDENTFYPPYSNRGGIDTSLEPLTSCVDWFSCTFFNVQKWQEIAAVFFLNIDDFECSDGGMNGYRKKAVFEHIQIYYEGHSESMGIFINLSGQGCRQLEEVLERLSMTWQDFFRYVRGYEINITRLDIAIDDFKGYFKIKQIEKSIKSGCVTSRFRTARNFEEHLLIDGSTLGQTIYFGKSEVIIRFYDKYQERLARNILLQEDVKFWQRTEIQLRGDRAVAAVDVIIHENHNLGDFVRGVLNKYLAFKIKGNDSNKARWKNTRWWDSFLNGVGKISLSMQAPDKSVMRTKHWIDNQVVGSFAMLYESLGNDPLLVDYMLTRGRDQMSDRQKQMANSFKLDIHKRLALKEQMKDELNYYSEEYEREYINSTSLKTFL